MPSPLELLAREDKWSLGCGDGIVFAPRFPVWLDAAGFWDEAMLHHYPVAPLFTVTALDEHGAELPMRAISRRWTPAELTVEYRLANGVTATETRTLQPDGVFASEWRLQALAPVRVHLVAWTAQEGATPLPPDAPAGGDGADSAPPPPMAWPGSLAVLRELRDDGGGAPLRVRLELACAGEPTSWASYVGEARPNHPAWRLTPFVEHWAGEALPRELLGGAGPATGPVDGLLHLAVHRALTLPGGGGASATFALRLAPEDAALRAAPPAAAAPPSSTFGAASRRRWQEHFDRAPRFHCSDPYLETYYWYRHYVSSVNAAPAGVGNYRHSAPLEGSGPLRTPNAYSAHCQARDLRWLADRAAARGALLTLFDHQRPDGSLPSRIHLHGPREGGHSHADWGGALLALDAVAPDDALLREIYPSLARYAEWLQSTRDAEESGLFDLLDGREAGLGGRSRFVALSTGSGEGDTCDGGCEIQRLKGVDITTFAYRIMRALERLAARAGEGSAARRWGREAERTARAVRESMWDLEAGMFSDVDPATGRRTGVRAAACFYPYLTDLADETHVAGLERNLLEPSRFWATFPVPALALDDPRADACAPWKGRRHDSAWSGRVWPLATSHLVDALGRTAREHAPRLRAPTARLLRRLVLMMFHDGDRKRPNAHEHYDPFSGHASVYRGIDDVQHAWVGDLILGYVMGVSPHPGGVVVDPFPFGLASAEVTGLDVRGASLDVRIDGERVTTTLDGVTHTTTIGVPLDLHIPARHIPARGAPVRTPASSAGAR
ncbi:MAG: MGH1-like glycoside hydrolase domain-containing protein [Gemmatimonadaceae bacterium]